MVAISAAVGTTLWQVVAMVIDVCSVEHDGAWCMGMTQGTDYPLPVGAFKHCYTDGHRWLQRAGCYASFAALHLSQAIAVLAVAAALAGAAHGAMARGPGPRLIHPQPTTSWHAVERSSVERDWAPSNGLPACMMRDSVSLGPTVGVASRDSLASSMVGGQSPL